MYFIYREWVWYFEPRMLLLMIHLGILMHVLFLMHNNFQWKSFEQTYKIGGKLAEEVLG